MDPAQSIARRVLAHTRAADRALQGRNVSQFGVNAIALSPELQHCLIFCQYPPTRRNVFHNEHENALRAETTR